MNTYERYGILKQLLDGTRIVIATTPGRSRRIFTAIAEEIQDRGEIADKVSAVNGEEKIEINGGRLSFATAPRDLNYSTADVLLVSADLRGKPDFYANWILRPGGSARIETLSS